MCGGTAILKKRDASWGMQLVCPFLFLHFTAEWLQRSRPVVRGFCSHLQSCFVLFLMSIKAGIREREGRGKCGCKPPPEEAAGWSLPASRPGLPSPPRCLKRCSTYFTWTGVKGAHWDGFQSRRLWNCSFPAFLFGSREAGLKKFCLCEWCKRRVEEKLLANCTRGLF